MLNSLHYTSLGGEGLRTWGWNVETQVELQQFLIGNRFIKGEYEICGNTIIYPFSANWFHKLWLNQSVFWLRGSIVYPDVRSHYLIDYWVSCLEHLHPLFFEPRLLRDYAVMLPQMRLKTLMAYCKEYDLDSIKIQRQQEKKIELVDNGERQAFLSELKTVFETADLPVPMKRLWQMAKEEKDFGPQSHGEIPENEDPSRLLQPDEFNKIFL